MTIQLHRDDFRRLVDVVQNLPAFGTVRDRRRLVAGALAGEPRAETILAGLDLDGPPRAVAVEVIRFLADFGQVASGREALWVFLEEILSDRGEGEDTDFIRSLFTNYAQSNPPTSKHPDTEAKAGGDAIRMDDAAGSTSRQQKRIAALQEQWDLLSQKLAVLEKQLILETRAEEKLRLQNLIINTRAELDQIESDLNKIEQPIK